MNIFDIIVILILIIGFIGGFFQGAVKSFFSLLVLIIAIPLTGISYHLMARPLSFLPGTDWDNFVAFFLTLTLISIILQLIFLLPRMSTRGYLLNKSILSRLIGCVLNLINSTIGIVVFALIVQAYPVSVWLERAVTGSSILTRLVAYLNFIRLLLPQITPETINTVMAWLSLYL